MSLKNRIVVGCISLIRIRIKAVGRNLDNLIRKSILVLTINIVAYVAKIRATSWINAIYLRTVSVTKGSHTTPIIRPTANRSLLRKSIRKFTTCKSVGAVLKKNKH